MPLLVMKFDKDKFMHSHVAPAKGLKHAWGARKTSDAILQSGFPKVIVNIDQEPAIL